MVIIIKFLDSRLIFAEKFALHFFGQFIAVLIFCKCLEPKDQVHIGKI